MEEGTSFPAGHKRSPFLSLSLSLSLSAGICEIMKCRVSSSFPLSSPAVAASVAAAAFTVV